MVRMESLNPLHHRQVKVDQLVARTSSADQRMMPVVLSEFRKLCIDFPILFAKNGDTGEFICVALFGFEDGENLFWQDGHWDAVYTPLHVRRQPFFVGANEDKQSPEDHDFLLCLDMDNAAISTGKGEALFDADGRGTAFLADMQKVMAELIEGEAQTRKFIEVMLALKLITPISLDITFADQQKMRAEGMYSVDEDKLGALTADQLAELQAQGYLDALYMMVASSGQIYALIQRKNTRLTAPSKWVQAAT